VRTIIAAIIVFLTITSTASASFKNGNDVLQMCTQPSVAKGSGPQDDISGLCYGYLAAVADATNYRNTSVFGWAACIPGEVRWIQVRDVVVQYLRIHAPVRDLNGAYLVGSALADAWPCVFRLDHWEPAPR
jgi:Rap1a immunity proteins